MKLYFVSRKLLLKSKTSKKRHISEIEDTYKSYILSL